VPKIFIMVDGLPRKDIFYMVGNYDSIEHTVKAISKISGLRDFRVLNNENWFPNFLCVNSEGLGYSEHRQKKIYIDGCMHDMGKVNVPAEIISKYFRLMNW